jgi:hypothetical protein
VANATVLVRDRHWPHPGRVRVHLSHSIAFSFQALLRALHTPGAYEACFQPFA